MLPSLSGLSVKDDGVETGPKADNRLSARDLARRQAAPYDPYPYNPAQTRGNYTIQDETKSLSFAFKRYSNKVMCSDEGVFATRKYSETSPVAGAIDSLQHWVERNAAMYIYDSGFKCSSFNCFVPNPPLNDLYTIANYIRPDYSATRPQLTLRVINLEKNKENELAHYRELILTSIASVEGIGPRIVAIVPFRNNRHYNVLSYAYVFESGWESISDFMTNQIGESIPSLIALGIATSRLIQKASSKGFVLGDIKPGNAIVRRVYNPLQPDRPSYEVACIDFDTSMAARRLKLTGADLRCIAMINFVLFMNMTVEASVTERTTVSHTTVRDSQGDAVRRQPSVASSVTSMVLAHHLKSFLDIRLSEESFICNAINMVNPLYVTKHDGRVTLPPRQMNDYEFTHVFADLFWNRVVWYCDARRWNEIRKKFGQGYTYMDSLVRDYILLGGLDPDLPSPPLQTMVQLGDNLSDGQSGSSDSSGSYSYMSDPYEEPISSNSSSSSWFGQYYGPEAEASLLQAYSDASMGLPPLAAYEVTSESMRYFLSQDIPEVEATAVEEPLGFIDYDELVRYALEGTS